MTDMTPHFLGIGAQKSGTSWLYQQLRQHPEVYFPPVKELHYFGDLKEAKNYSDRINQHIWRKHFSRLIRRNPKYIRWHLNYLFGDYSPKWYSSLFASAGDRLAGEITPKYAKLSSRKIKEISCINPKMRLIYLLRDPTSRAWSHFRMLVKKRGLVFERMSDNEVLRIISSKNCIQRGYYHETLERWYRIFPEDQFLIGFMEQIKNNPDELLKSILAHLGVTQDTSYFRHSMNLPTHVGQQIPMKPKFEEFLREKFYKQNVELYKMIGNPVINEWNKMSPS